MGYRYPVTPGNPVTQYYKNELKKIINGNYDDHDDMINWVVALNQLAAEVCFNLQHTRDDGTVTHAKFMSEELEIGRPDCYLEERIYPNAFDDFERELETELVFMLRVQSYDKISFNELVVARYNPKLKGDGFIEMYERCITSAEINNWNFIQKPKFKTKYELTKKEVIK